MDQPATGGAGSGDVAASDPTRPYRHALGSFATGLTVVTCVGADGLPTGLTVNSFASVSLRPPLVSWCLSRHALSFAAFADASHFAVNVLSADQQALVEHFAQRTLDKFATVASTPGLGGAPLLAGTAAHFECRRVAAHDGGDHVIFVGEVERYDRFDAEPLILVRGRYGTLNDG